MTHADWRGTEIEIGSTVVYPWQRSSSVGLNEGIVVGFLPPHLNHRGWVVTRARAEVQRTYRYDSYEIGELSQEHRRPSYVEVAYLTVVTPRPGTTPIPVVEVQTVSEAA